MGSSLLMRRLKHLLTCDLARQAKPRAEEGLGPPVVDHLVMDGGYGSHLGLQVQASQDRPSRTTLEVSPEPGKASA
jgi:hypothetical protein